MAKTSYYWILILGHIYAFVYYYVFKFFIAKCNYATPGRAGTYEARADIVAFDATAQVRPDGRAIRDFIHEIKNAYPNLLLMADVSTYEEGCASAAMGVDVVAITLCG